MMLVYKKDSAMWSFTVKRVVDKERLTCDWCPFMVQAGGIHVCWPQTMGENNVTYYVLDKSRPVFFRCPVTAAKIPSLIHRLWWCLSKRREFSTHVMEGGKYPVGYGPSYLLPDRLIVVCHPWPVNVFIGLARKWWYRIRYYRVANKLDIDALAYFIEERVKRESINAKD